MIRRCWFLGGVLLVVSSCNSTSSTTTIRSLSASGEVSLICRDMVTGEGLELGACPDPYNGDVSTDMTRRHLWAMVTQTERGEVAAVDLQSQTIIDNDPAVPGINFLPIGASPTGIVSTPGGSATFVGVADVGREGIFAIPTICADAPAAGETARSLALWSACSLPSAPGELAIITDSEASSDAGLGTETSTTLSGYRTQCPGATYLSGATPWDPSDLPSGTKRDDACAISLVNEEHVAPVGRRKLLVTLPSEGSVVVIDAQALLNRQPGSFSRCPIERTLSLQADPGSLQAAQNVPSDLVPDATCSASTGPVYGFTPPTGGYSSIPAGLSVLKSRAFVADLGTPVIHSLDVSNACELKENDPLLPRAYDEPTRTVVTRQVAVSPVTNAGKQFVYATDDHDGSVMVFDISADSSFKTPLVRDRSAYLIDEPPDRIKLNSPIKSLLIVGHDAPRVDDSTGTTTEGVECDPRKSADVPANLYRTASDYSAGAGPKKLRGIFGLLGMAKGQIAVADIEDWDAPCRRPSMVIPLAAGTPSGTLDWRGCSDPAGEDSYIYHTTDGSLGVSDEVTCSIAVQHRVRSGRYLISNDTLGTLAPTLPSWPRLTSSKQGDLISGNSDGGLFHPHMLAVPFTVPNGDSKSTVTSTVNVGMTTYGYFSSNFDLAGAVVNSLPLSPTTADGNSLFLPLIEPRVYSTSESFTATYEGQVVLPRYSGVMTWGIDDSTLSSLCPSSEPGCSSLTSDATVLLSDYDAGFCDQGVEDEAVQQEQEAPTYGITDTDKLRTFRVEHADYVQLTDEFDEDDVYWASASGSPYGTGEDLYNFCRDNFGDLEDGQTTRDLRIVRAYHDKLVLTPRTLASYQTTSGATASLSAKEQLRRIRWCFPGVLSYVVRGGSQWVVRGSSFLHDVVIGDSLHCVKDCSPRRAHLHGRVLEVSSSVPCTDYSWDGTGRRCAIGSANSADAADAETLKEDLACVIDDPARGLDPTNTVESRCVFDSLKGRFAIYRGLNPSERDMSFTWQVQGGFQPLTASLASNTASYSIMANSMLYVSQGGFVLVIDPVSGGVNFVSLTSFGLIQEPLL